MFRSKTLFIIGAGASKEAGLPVGSELAAAISKLLYFEFEFGQLKGGDHSFLDLLRRHFGNNTILNEHLHVARQISEGIYLANSIDNYIDIHRHDEKIQFCGKAAILYSILVAERKSRLYINKSKRRSQIDFSSLENTWYVQFAKLLFDGVPLSKLDDVFNNVAIVCFNYDRCIEHFLMHALMALYAIPEQQARKVVLELKVYHPYGLVGASPAEPSPHGIEFGAEIHSIGSSCNLLKTYTEQIRDEGLIAGLREEVARAETVVFLGFGYHQQNMLLISPQAGTSARRVFGTAKGFSKDDTNVVANQVYGIINNGARLGTRKLDMAGVVLRHDLGCGDILKEYRRSLTQ
jgi:hypothetical protein